MLILLPNYKIYFRIAAGNPNLFVPNDETIIKWSTFATVAANKTVLNYLKQKTLSGHTGITQCNVFLTCID
jgi:hypothetical protein